MIGSTFKKYLFAAFEKRAPEINLRDSRNGRLVFFFNLLFVISLFVFGLIPIDKDLLKHCLKISPIVKGLLIVSAIL